MLLYGTDYTYTGVISPYVIRGVGWHGASHYDLFRP